MTAISNITILYDGQCPLCSSYVKYYRLKNTTDQLILIDARQDTPLKREIMAKGWNLDEGMVLKINDNYYFGSQAMHMLALMTTPHGWFNRLNVLLFSSSLVAKLLYPLCRIARSIALRLKGIPNIRNLKE